jgi:hypothetical protein
MSSVEAFNKQLDKNDAVLKKTSGNKDWNVDDIFTRPE